MKVAGTGIPFAETVVSLEATDFKERIVKMSGADKVPVLLDGDVRVWESLAILEYLSEKFPATGLWPCDAAARGHARAIAAEMHAGFQPLRRQLPMSMWRPMLPRLLEPDALSDVARIEAIWSECRARLGQGARSCTAGSEQPMPRMRRWFHASTPMRSTSALLRGIHACGHGAAVVERVARRRAARDLDPATRRGRLARGQAGGVTKLTPSLAASSASSGRW